MAISLLDLFNQAILHTGTSDTLTSLDKSAQAKACFSFYRTEFDSLLTKTPWPFSYRYVDLPQLMDVATPADAVALAFGSMDGMAWNGSGWLIAVGSDYVQVTPNGTVVSRTALRDGSTALQVQGIAFDGAAPVVVTEGAVLYELGTTPEKVGEIEAIGPRGLAWDGFDLYLITQSSLYVVSRETAESVEIGPHNVPFVTGLAWDGYKLHTLGGPATDRAIYRLNRHTGGSNRLAKINNVKADAIGWNGTHLVIASATELRQVGLGQTERARERYLLPDDFVRLWNWEDSDRRPPAGAVEGDTFRSMAGGDDLAMPYSARVPLSVTDALFDEALAVNLGRRIAPSIGKDPRVAGRLWAESTRLVNEARAVARSQRQETERTDITEVGRTEIGTPFGLGRFVETREAPAPAGLGPAVPDTPVTPPDPGRDDLTGESYLLLQRTQGAPTSLPAGLPGGPVTEAQEYTVPQFPGGVDHYLVIVQRADTADLMSIAVAGFRQTGAFTKRTFTLAGTPMEYWVSNRQAHPGLAGSIVRVTR